MVIPSCLCVGPLPRVTIIRYCSGKGVDSIAISQYINGVDWTLPYDDNLLRMNDHARIHNWQKITINNCSRLIKKGYKRMEACSCLS